MHTTTHASNRGGLTAGLALAVALLAATPARAETQATVAAEPATRPPVSLMALEFGAGAAAAAVTVSGSLALGTWLGTVPTGIVTSALPPFLLLAVLPPLAVTATTWLVANSSDEFESSWNPAIWAGLGVQVLTITGATLLGANTGNLASAAGLVVASSVLVPAAVTAAMNLWGTTPKAKPAAVRGRDDAGELSAALRGPEPVVRASDASGPLLLVPVLTGAF